MSNDHRIGVERAATIFKALSNPQRLRIFLKFCASSAPTACAADADGMACCVGDLGRALGLVPSTVSHHIKELRQAGLLQVERRGQRIECRICGDALSLLESFFQSARDGQAYK